MLVMFLWKKILVILQDGCWCTVPLLKAMKVVGKQVGAVDGLKGYQIWKKGFFGVGMED
jgi:hypothetical protein